MTPKFKAAIEIFLAAANEELTDLQNQIKTEGDKEEIDEDKIDELEEKSVPIENIIAELEELE